MSAAVVWLLIAVSTGNYNRGTVVVIDRFATQQDCFNVRVPLERTQGGNVDYICIEAKVAK